MVQGLGLKVHYVYTTASQGIVSGHNMRRFLWLALQYDKIAISEGCHLQLSQYYTLLPTHCI